MLKIFVNISKYSSILGYLKSKQDGNKQEMNKIQVSSSCDLYCFMLFNLDPSNMMLYTQKQFNEMKAVDFSLALSPPLSLSHWEDKMIKFREWCQILSGA